MVPAWPVSVVGMNLLLTGKGVACLHTCLRAGLPLISNLSVVWCGFCGVDTGTDDGDGAAQGPDAGHHGGGDEGRRGQAARQDGAWRVVSWRAVDTCSLTYLLYMKNE